MGWLAFGYLLCPLIKGNVWYFQVAGGAHVTIGRSQRGINLHRGVVVGGIGGVGRRRFPLSLDGRGIGVSGLARTALFRLLFGGCRVLVGGIFGFRLATGLLAGHTGGGQADLGAVLGRLLRLHDTELGGARTGINNYLVHIGGCLRDSVIWDSEEVPDSWLCAVVCWPWAVPTGTEVPVVLADDRLGIRNRVRGPQCLVSCRVVVSLESEPGIIEYSWCGTDAAMCW